MTSNDSLRPAVFLDRDGTLIEERGYAATADEVALLPGAAGAVRQLNRAGIPAVLITNQSGIGRGYFDRDAVDAQHRRLQELLAAGGAYLDGCYVCPHHPDDGCECRKPAAGMLTRAATELGLDLERSWVIGDRPADVECGERGAAGGILVLTGYGRTTAEEQHYQRVCPDVAAAVQQLLPRLTGHGEV